MKGKQKWLSLATCLLIMIYSTSAVYGEQTGNLVISYVPLATFHEMQIIVIGGGCYKDGNIDVCTGNQVYKLTQDDIKTFTIYPSKGYQVKSILYDGLPVQMNEKRQIEVPMKDHNTILIITFEKETQEVPKEEPSIPKEEPIIPTIPPSLEEEVKDEEEDEEEEKEIVSMVVKRGSIDDDDIDEYLKKTIKGKFTILSHNIQNEDGTYEVVVQLEDGSIQNIQVEVEGESSPKDGGNIVTETNPSNTYMASVTALYSGYFLMNVLKKKIRQEVMTKRFDALTLMFVGSISLIQMLNENPMDNKVYVGYCLVAGASSGISMLLKFCKRKGI